MIAFLQFKPQRKPCLDIVIVMHTHIELLFAYEMYSYILKGEGFSGIGPIHSQR